MRQNIAIPCKNYSSSVRRQGSLRTKRMAKRQTDSDYDDTVDESVVEDSVRDVYSPRCPNIFPHPKL